MKTKKADKRETITHVNLFGRKHLGREVECKVCNWFGGKSSCTCNHEGDGSPSQHQGALGHGSCSMPSCTCEKFTWRNFLSTYEAAQKRYAVKA